jgi:hypothetical protein
MLLLILLICIILLKAITSVNTEKIKSLDEIYNLAENGDLIYFRWTKVSFLHEMISPFTHIGIIIINPETNEKLIVESHLAGDTKHIGNDKGGINTYPLKLRLSTYDGYTFLSKIKIHPTDTDTLIFWRNLETFKSNIPFNNKYEEYFKKTCIKRRLCEGCFDVEKRDDMMCSEFVGFALKQLNILPKDFNHECLAPGDFRYINYINYINYNKEKLYGNIIMVKK